MRNSIDERISEQAALYALGMLSQTEAQNFARCLSEQQEGYAEELAAFAAVVAELGLSAPEQAPPGRVRNQLLFAVASEAVTTEMPPVRSTPLPAPQLHSVKFDEGKWKKLAAGVFVKTLFVNQENETITSLVKLEPGARFPRHRHPGIEESVVILGDCHVNGDVLTPGDYRRADAGTTDGEITTINGTTYLVIASRKVEILEADWAS